MTPDELFLFSIRDLARATVKLEDEYQLVTVSGVLRRLLLDEHPLMHQVNRTRRLKIVFEPNSERLPFVQLIMEAGPTFWAWLDAFSPDLSQGMPVMPEQLTLDQFLKKRAAIVDRQDVSVRDLILQIANVGGGVHAGTPKTDLERSLQAASRAVRIGGMSSIERTIRGIAAVTAGALIPLADVVKGEIGH